jgi:signal transduction histidine kinase
MQQLERTAEFDGMERKRVEAVVETLANLRSAGENVAEVAHDARNMVTALGLYCDLLEEPGVLATPFVHYGSELRLVAAASRRLVEKLVALDTMHTPTGELVSSGLRGVKLPDQSKPESKPMSRWELLPVLPIEDLADELRGLRSLLTSLAGPAITLTMETEGGGHPVHLSAEDLTRILVNLVKNSSEAMPAGGRIALGLHEFHSGTGCPPWMVLTIEDSGPGIEEGMLDKVFEPGYSTRIKRGISGTWPSVHQGLGLSITRSIVEGAGGKIHAANLVHGGARFEIELPVRER